MEYFDYAGTSPLNTKIFKEIMEANDFSDLFGNPSSNHNMGIRAKNILTLARKLVAENLGCKPEEIIFTSGGTESDNTAIFGIMYSDNKKYIGKNELIVSKIEHPAILNAAKELEKRGFVVKYIDVDENGVIKLEQLQEAITDKTRLISIMSVNNETGVIQPINEISKLAKINKVIFHTDAVQAIGLTNIDIKKCDLLSLSGHKFGAFKGTGILYKKKNVKLAPFIFGGGQENGYRSGTENVFGNLMLALCLEDFINNWEENKERIKYLRQYIIETLEKEFGELVRFNGNINNKVCNNINVSFKYLDAQTIQLLLINNGIDISIGSACHSSNTEPSYVLQSMKIPEDFLNGTIRITLGYDTDNSAVQKLLSSLINSVSYLYKLKGGN